MSAFRVARAGSLLGCCSCATSAASPEPAGDSSDDSVTQSANPLAEQPRGCEVSPAQRCADEAEHGGVVDGEADGDACESPRESPSRSASFSLWDANRLRSFTSMSLLSLTSDSSEWAACEDDKELEGDYGWYEDITHDAL